MAQRERTRGKKGGKRGNEKRERGRAEREEADRRDVRDGEVTVTKELSERPGKAH